MKYLTIILFFFWTTGYSQEKPFEILLKSDSIVTTDWLIFKDFPIFQNPYIKIDSLNGPKIKIRDIKSYQGYDQFGNYRQLVNIDFALNKASRFTELMYQTDSIEHVKILYTQLTFGNGANSSKIHHSKYQLNNLEVKNLNNNNIKQDFSRQAYSKKNLSAVNRIRVLQYTSLAIATGLLLNLTYNNWNPGKEGFMDSKDNFVFITCGLLYAFPFTLEKTKKRKLVESLKNY